ncbi:S1 family peptidase [Thermodesulfobacteriota bacterium B35]
MQRFLFIVLLVALLAVSITLPVDAGTDPAPPAGKVLGGSDTAPGSWPWMVALLNAAEPDLYYAQFCGGALISADWVVTAAHCVASADADDIDVAIGIRDLNNFNGPRLAVNVIVVHPAFSTTSLTNDIALLRLATPAAVEPLTLFSGQSRDNTPPSLLGRSTTLLGWGLYNTSGYPYFPSILQQVDLPVVSDSLCSSAFGIPLADSQICAGYTVGKDACRGDSGGPLLVQVDNRWAHAGLVSYGTNCLQQGGFYGVYTRTSSFIGFIRHYVPDVRLTSETPPGLPWLLLLMR